MVLVPTSSSLIIIMIIMSFIQQGRMSGVWSYPTIRKEEVVVGVVEVRIWNVMSAVSLVILQENVAWELGVEVEGVVALVQGDVGVQAMEGG